MAIKQVSFVSVYVTDQDEALDFYTNKLGFEVRMDNSSQPGMRWLMVAPPGAQTSLTLTTPESMQSSDPEQHGPDPAGFAKSAMGRLLWLGFDVDDADATYDELSARGVKFAMKPEQQPWGAKMGIIEDPFGNKIVFTGWPQG